MEIIIYPDLYAWTIAAAQEVSKQIRLKPDSVIGLATGSTTVPLYAALADIACNAEIDFSRGVTFNLDEYVGIPPTHPMSCRARLEAQLFSHVPIARENIHFLDGQAGSLEVEGQEYEQEIRQHGRIDLQILGIGLNGHIGFNEPGTSFESTTHIAEIAAQTRVDKTGFFGSPESVPHLGITLGIKTIMQARNILLLAYGKDKAVIVAQALSGPMTPQIPASVLQRHPNLVVILDQSAAEGLHSS